MKKRLLFTLPACVLLLTVIMSSFFLMRIQPDASNVSQAQKLAEHTKPAVVRVISYAVVEWQFDDYYSEVTTILNEMNNQTLIGGMGSGAIISSNGYIVTNAHVVEPSKMEEEEIVAAAFNKLVTEVSNYYGLDYGTIYDYMLYYTSYTKVTRVLKVILPGGDILDGEVKSYGAPINEGKDVAVLKVEGKNLPTLKLGDSDTVQNQDSIWVIGYPAAADSDLLSPESSLVSSMNAGHVSANSKKTEQGSPVIQIDAAATNGNSGGPVINENGEIIGLLTFKIDTGNGESQGFNFAIPVNTVKEFVNQAGAKNTQSATDKLYQEGLNYFWAGYYKNALEKFEAVQRIYPNHSEIKRYITESEQKKSESKILWSDYKTIFYIVDGVSGLLIILLLVFTFAFKPKQKTPKLAVVTNNSPQATNQPDDKSPQMNITDLNNDGKIDMNDILLALQEQQKKQNEQNNQQKEE